MTAAPGTTSAALEEHAAREARQVLVFHSQLISPPDANGSGLRQSSRTSYWSAGSEAASTCEPAEPETRQTTVRCSGRRGRDGRPRSETEPRGTLARATVRGVSFFVSIRLMN